jgi:tetratricopeptide (TPR) repeat protein
MSIDPALLEERDFLLGSLDDLEAEYAAGDLDDADYESLKADYTTRAARVLRAIEAGEHPAPIESPTAKGTGWMWLAGIAVVATLVGILLAQFSGSRTLNDTITGEIRVTTRELLLEAQQLLGEGDLDAAIDVYDDVLELSPANTEALAYKAWFLRLQGNVDDARPLVEDAVAIDPEYADARVFATAIALDVGDVDVAKGHLDAFDQLDAPPFIEQLVVQQGLRDRLAEIARNDALTRVEPLALVDDPVPFSETELTVDDVVFAAEALAAQGEPFTGIQLGEWMLESVPEDPDALAGQGWLLARSATPDALAPAEIGLTFLDRALGVEPAHPEALVYRAFVHNFLGDPVSAAADLAAFDDLDTRPADLRGLILAFGLRESIGAS